MKNRKLRNLDGLIIVCAIFIALGCRCQSSLFGDNKSSNSETNASVSINASDNSTPRSGRDVFGDNSANTAPPKTSPDESRGGRVERSSGGTTADKLPASVGKYSLSSKEKGEPVRDGFTGASEVWKAKYADAQNNTVQYAVAQFASPGGAEQNVKQTRDEFSKRGGQVSEIDTATDNDRNPIGIVFSIKGRGNLVYYWTSGKYVYAIIGPERAAEEFFGATETPLEP